MATEGRKKMDADLVPVEVSDRALSVDAGDWPPETARQSPLSAPFCTEDCHTPATDAEYEEFLEKDWKTQTELHDSNQS